MCAITRSGRGERGILIQYQRITKGTHMNRLIYIIGAIVVIVAVLSFFGLR